jgi:hypothetical protein
MKNDPATLWSLDAAEHVSMVFKQHSDASGRLSIRNLFDFIKCIGMDDLDMSAKQQKLIADIIRTMMDGSQGGRTNERRASQGGVLSLQDAFYIVTQALHQDQCEKRRQELRNEQKLRREYGFSVSDVEDLHELHRTFRAQLENYSTMLPDNTEIDSRAVTSQLAVLLEHCHVKKLVFDELQSLRELVFEKPPEPGGHVPFDSFVHWMHGVFTQQLGGLERQDSSEKKMEGDSFVSTLLRECADANGNNEDSHTPVDDNPVVQVEAVVTEHEAGAETESSTDESSSSKAPVSRHNRRRKTLAKLGFMAKDANPRTNSRKQPYSRSTGAQDSRSASREDLSSTADKAPSSSRGNDDGDKFCLKGLPPSEAMLGRREIRACSLDADPVTFVEQLNTVLPPDAQITGSTGPPGPVQAVDTSSSRTDPALAHPSSRSCAASAPALVRKVKPVQDAATVVQGAIARLDDLAGMGPDSGNES